jgi:hypothetical protein
LARQRDPGPPATILAPAALTLRHAPIADCARYDNLRGASGASQPEDQVIAENREEPRPDIEPTMVSEWL